MKSHPFLLFICLIVFIGCNTTPFNSDHHSGVAERNFHVRYVTSMKDCPVGEKFRLWIPIPHDDYGQRIANMTFSGSEALSKGTLRSENTFGNQMYYVEGVCSASQMDFTIEYDVVRSEYSMSQQQYAQSSLSKQQLQTYLKPSTLCFVTPQIKKEAEQLTTGKTSTVDKTRAFFNHILDEMAYDKQHSGWGRGDILHACDVGKGNCTDFHTYFNALCLASDIPSRFQIGMWGKYDEVSGEYKTGGYHCWAQFYVDGTGWIPVDISEADKVETDRARFFGSQTANRVTLSSGRDITLTPKQSGPPLNYFVNPYAEIGGQPFTNVSKNCFWTDMPLE